jgi:hypothetical protein
MKFSIILINIYLIMSMNILGQDFSKHKWENRLIIIIAQDINNSIYQKQIKEFIAHEEGLVERKVLVYQILPKKYKIGLNPGINWEENSHHQAKDIPFEIRLIGLDGSVKLSQKELLTSDKLFSLIDRMPVRRIEIEKNRELD